MGLLMYGFIGACLWRIDDGRVFGAYRQNGIGDAVK